MTNHELVAAEIAANVKLPTTEAPKRGGRHGNILEVPQRGGRQGDVVFVFVSDEVTGTHSPTPKGGIVIAAGRHGEHRLIGDAVRVETKGEAQCVSVGGDGAILVHTDVPEERHGGLFFNPGTWTFHRARELSIDQTIVRVED